ncbi:hypothetical protein [Pokkaliibacter plantistimulans]|uniref:hypothetical protein n=1 Tax=Pokkaliibacter plantistimulans TaxID=1635171 RepID=UPI001402E032|nr:hypothetical protein [Pokkaliibacter plantistimulans]
MLALFSPYTLNGIPLCNRPPRYRRPSTGAAPTISGITSVLLPVGTGIEVSRYQP